MTIFTDAKGRPFERPERPADDAGIEERIAWMRAMYAYNDAVTDCASRAFADGFNRRVRS